MAKRKKLTYDEAMQHINEERILDADDVLASALRRKVWVGMACYPGCLPEQRVYADTKARAVESLVGYDEDFRGKNELLHTQAWRLFLEGQEIGRKEK